MPSCLDCWISHEREMLLLSGDSESVSAGRGISWRSAVCSFWGYCMTEFILIKPEEYLLSGNADLLCELDLEWFPVPSRECPFHRKTDLRRYWLMQEREIKGIFVWTAMFWGHNLDFMWSELFQKNLSVHSSVCQEQYVQGVSKAKIWDTTVREVQEEVPGCSLKSLQGADGTSFSSAGVMRPCPWWLVADRDRNEPQNLMSSQCIKVYIWPLEFFQVK